jgi:peptide/nickel transport system substrate-binding protein
MMSIWYGLDNGVPTADMNPGALAPTMEDQVQWPLWGVHYVTAGEQGQAPDLPEVARQVELLKEWRAAGEESVRTRIWHEMLSTYTQQVYSIGLVNQTFQPIVRHARLQNLPEHGLYGFEPTSYLGVYHMDTFWLGDA